MKKCIFSFFLLSILPWPTCAQEVQVVPETHVALVTKRTATWCGVCGGFAWDMMKRIQEGYDSTQVVAVNAHHSSSSKLYSEVAAAWIDAFEASFSQPRFYVGTSVIGSGSASTENAIDERIQEVNTTTPVAQSGLSLAYEPNTRSLRLRATMKFNLSGVTGTYRLGFYLVEKEVISEQSSRASEALHTNVLRESLTADPFGQVMYQGASMAPETFTTEVFYTLPEAYDIDNIRILSVIWNAAQGQIKVVNVHQTDQYDLMQTTSLNQPLIPGRFGLLQNPVPDQLQLTIEPARHLARLSWAVINSGGQVLEAGNWADLNPGHHNRTVPTRPLPGGYYVLLLRSEDQAVHLPFIKKG